MIKKIAITGGTGFLGNVIIQKLLQQNYQIKALQHQDIYSLAPHANLEIVLGDIRNKEHVQELVADADAVIHSASFVSIVNYQNKQLESVNIEGTTQCPRSVSYTTSKKTSIHKLGRSNRKSA